MLALIVGRLDGKMHTRANTSISNHDKPYLMRYTINRAGTNEIFEDTLINLGQTKERRTWKPYLDPILKAGDLDTFTQVGLF